MNPREPRRPPVHILGVGSIGGWFAVRLAAADVPVALLLRNAAAVTAYQAAAGIHVSGPGDIAQHAHPPAELVTDSATQPGLLLVTTKTPDTLTALAPRLAGDGAGQLVVLLQNGMGISERVRARWPEVRLWNAVTTAGVWRTSQFDLHCVAIGETHIGRYDDAGDAMLDVHVDALTRGGLMTPATDMRQLLWRKLAVNAALNALTALHACRNGDLLTIPEARAQMAMLALEIEQVAAAENMRFDEPVLAMTERVARLTADNYSSMNRDAAAGRPTEIDFINGYVVACAQRYGIAVPANEQMLHAVRALVKKGPA